MQDDPGALLADRQGPVLVAGRAGMDLYPVPVGSKIRQAREFQADLGGSAGNIAVALGNANTTNEVIESLRNRLDKASDMLAEHIHWALAQHGIG